MSAMQKGAVGLAYSLEGMLHAKCKTWEAIDEIHLATRPFGAFYEDLLA